jgi:hypothetical protein
MLNDNCRNLPNDVLLSDSSDPMEFLGPIMVHLREAFGSHNVLKRFHNSP